MPLIDRRSSQPTIHLGLEHGCETASYNQTVFELDLLALPGKAVSFFGTYWLPVSNYSVTTFKRA